jgi:GxxExxY protein
MRELNDISGEIVDASVRVHSTLGPGLLESAYQTCLAYELRERGQFVRTQVPLPVVYRGIEPSVGYRVDLLVDDAVMAELKTVPNILPVHEAQLLTYLKMSDRRLGLLLNFHVPLMRDGTKRLVNKF